MAPAKPAAFSRLQLAAALLEYDNDPDDPDAPCRSAHESAIFAHLRPLNRTRKSTDYLGVQVPSEVGSDPPNRKPRGSIDTLHNPFGNDEDESGDEAVVAVDLTSWGLDAFMDKDKAKGKGKARAKSEIFPNPHVKSGPAPTAYSVPGDTPRNRNMRSMSVGALNDFGVGGAFLDGPDSQGRVRSMADLDYLQSPLPPLQRRRASTHVLIETLPVPPPLHSVPFPSVSVSGRSSPGPEEILRPGSRSSRLDFQTAHESYGSLGSKALLNDVADDEDANANAHANPFAVQPPSPDRASRFDPKAKHDRTMSNGSIGTMASKNMLTDENVFSVRPPSPSRSSRFDPKTHGRTLSVNSMGTRMLLENEVDGESRRDRPLSTLELLRPKVLVMPSPLQSTVPGQSPEPAMRPHSGLEVSTDGSLLPTARSSHPSVPVASNSFTPNPRASLSVSQLAFRNTLVVGGQRDIAYSDIDRYFPRALRDGEQAQFEMEEEMSPVPSSIPLPPDPPPTELEVRRPAGRLYGRSLIDNLEHRKLEMKQRARTFQGDNRPSMMVRGQMRRSSTFIDPDELGSPSTPQDPGNRTSAFVRRNSSSRPFLNVNGDKPHIIGPSASTGNLPQSRSVFGVDTLWDRELQKLKEIEAQERAEVEEHRRREQADVERRLRKKKKKGKSQLQETESTPPDANPHDVPDFRVSSEPPMLPAIQKPILRRAQVADHDDMESESDDDDDVPLGLGQSHGRIRDRAVDNWVAESSDEDEDAKRTTSIRPRNVSSSVLLTGRPGEDEDSEEDLPLTAAAARIVKRATQSQFEDSEEDLPLSVAAARVVRRAAQSQFDDSEEDLPLTAAAERIAKRATQFSPPRYIDDEDEDKPLAAVLSETRISTHRSRLSLPDLNFDNNVSGEHPSRNVVDEDEDEQPLGLRASRLPAMTSHASLPNMEGDEEDDTPLALHPEQQRKTQYQMLAHLQQQQQMMMQAQMHNNFYFGSAPMMGSGFFGPPMGMAVPPLMGMGIPMPPSPPPVHDAAKYGRVDRWRHDVAVEGEQ